LAANPLAVGRASEVKRELFLTRDGSEGVTSTVECSEAAARDIALVILNDAIEQMGTGYCTVFDGCGDGAEPLGAWIVDEPGQVARWEPED
jgi:hypothetical protein